MRSVLGLDGCPTGWVAVRLDDGAVTRVAVVGSLDEALASGVAGEPGGLAAVGIDMPVGLVDGLRDTDRAARARLKGRASSVFSAAPRTVVEGWRSGRIATHAAASAAASDVTGQGLSQQAWRLVPRMAEVEDAVARGVVLTEVHPELAFATVVGSPLPRKRSWPGVAERRRVLEGLGLRLPDRFPRDTEAAPDDVLDAAICAWVADGLAGAPGTISRVPEETSQRAHGRPIAITVRRPA